MPLDGLRAWIGEVERKLGMRTRVFLVLTVIAVGGAGAAIYLAVDARDSSVSESDVQALQDRLEAQIGSGSGSAGTDLAALEAELNALQAEVTQLSSEGTNSAESGGEGSAGKGGSPGGGDSGNTEGGSSPGGSSPGSSSPGSSSPGAESGTSGEGPSGASLPELIEKGKKQSEQANAEQGER
jgi:hypothetical protein